MGDGCRQRLEHPDVRYGVLSMVVVVVGWMESMWFSLMSRKTGACVVVVGVVVDAGEAKGCICGVAGAGGVDLVDVVDVVDGVDVVDVVDVVDGVDAEDAIDFDRCNWTFFNITDSTRSLTAYCIFFDRSMFLFKSLVNMSKWITFSANISSNLELMTGKPPPANK